MIQDSTEENSIVLDHKNEIQEDILIYPNPNNRDFVIKLNNPSMVKEIRIVNNIGKSVHSLKNIARENHFNLNYLTSGTYTVEIVYQNDNYLEKNHN